MVPTAPITSESEEMYLIHIAMAGEEGLDGPVPLRHLAEMLSVTPVSANQMVKKLAGRNLVQYQPYHGVSLTPAGREIAGRVLRGRRLWGVFLSERLGLSPDQADTIACDLEHITPPDVADRLAELLGDPSSGPGGRPIPGPGIAPAASPVPLDGLTAGQSGEIVAVHGTDALQAFCRAEGLTPGTRVTVLAAGALGRLLRVGTGNEVHLSAEAGAGIYVAKTGHD
jgi:DtxR family Mn-dependent transcriptional regulator